MTLLRATNLTRLHGSRRILDDVELSFQAGDKVGLIGANGAGKSTLMRILAGQLEFDEGRIEKPKGLLVRFLEQQPNLEPSATVGELLRAGQQRRAALERELEEIHEALAATADEKRIQRLLDAQSRAEERLELIGGHGLDSDLDKLVTGLGLPPLDARARDLSGGEARRTALACALVEQPDLLLLDEPTNHLDQEGIEWVEKTLQQLGGTFLLVTHDRALLDACATRIVELDRGKLYASDGNYTTFLEGRAARLEKESKDTHNRNAFLRRELDWIRRGPKARTTKSKARVQRFDAVAAVQTEVVGEVSLRFPPGPRLGTRGLHATQVGHRYGERCLFAGIDLELGAGDRLGLVGRNGSGKTTLMRILAGALEPSEGSASVGSTVRLASLPQDASGIDLEMPLIDFILHSGEKGAQAPAPHTLHGFLEQMLFPPEVHQSPLRDFSGGERRRAQIARLLRERGNVLLLDEPTNDLDLPTLRVLEEALLTFEGIVLIVSHDRWFLERVATRVLEIDEQARVHDYPGGFAEFQRKREERRAAASASAASKSAKKASAPPPKPMPAKARLTWNEQRELEVLPAQVEKLDAEVAALEAQLADPALYSSPDGGTKKAKELGRQLETKRGESTAAYARWEELESRS